MSFNSSSPSSISPLPLHLFSPNSSLHLSFYLCFKDRTAIIILTAFSVTNILICLPLFIFVLCVGLQRWRKRRSVVTNHTDFFTYNIIAMEMIIIVGTCFYCCGVYTNVQSLLILGMYISFIISPGKTLFHLLTCMERYLAAVHPITYLGLRQGGGVRIRNLSAGCVWLMSFTSLGVAEDFINEVSSIPVICFWVVSVVTVSFLSLSVLCVLIRPRPGDGGGNRDRANQSIQRAFNTIVATLGVLLFRFAGYLASAAMMYAPAALSMNEKCAVMMSTLWFSLPSSLLLPLLFLHRAGKLPGCKHNAEAGRAA